VAATTPTTKPQIAIVIPCFNEAGNIPLVNQALNSLFEMQSEFYVTILFVDDGSVDDTWPQIASACSQNRLKTAGLRLSRNFGHQKALLAGIESAVLHATHILTMDADLQHPVQTSMQLINKALGDSNDIVIAQRRPGSKETIFKKTTSRVFYSFLNYIGAEITPNASDFRIMSSRAAKALISHQEAAFFQRGLVSSIGFKQSVVFYDQQKRVCGKSKYSLTKMIRLASDAITSLSVAPLRLAFIASLLSFIACILMSVFILTSWLSGDVVQGWASILFTIYILFALNFLLLGLLGEYLGKTYKQTLQRPRYIVQDSIGL